MVVVSRVAGRCFVRVGLDAVEAGELVAEAARKGRQGRRATEALEQQVGGGVVAEGDGGIAEFGQRHRLAAHARQRGG